MAFVRAKKIGNQFYYYLVECYAVPGRKNPKMRNLKYLGKEIPEGFQHLWQKRGKHRDLHSLPGRKNGS